MFIILFNSVQTDGKGDFSHLIDIYSALRSDPKLNQIKIIPVIHTSLYPVENFECQLRKLNLDEYFITNEALEEHQPICSNVQLQIYLSQAIQFFLISYRSFAHDDLKQYFNPAAITKYIGEHEAGDQYESSIFKISRSMGLSKGKYGIKLSNQKKTLEECLVDENDSIFLNTLLENTNSADIDSFKKNYLFATAYFSEILVFLKFLLFISNNENLNNNDVVIFFSGNFKSLKKSLDDNFINKNTRLSKLSYFSNSNIKTIELITKDSKNRKIYPINNSGSKTLKIFANFFLSDEFYNHIYQWAFIAGVSGDNTLEKAISNKVLPYYCSTNFDFKKPTIKALQAISKQVISNDNSLANEFNCYFDVENFQCYNYYLCNTCDSYFDTFKKINLKGLIDNWNKIADYIIEHYNFYDKLPEIFYEGLDPQLINQINSTERKLNSMENDNSTFDISEYTYSQISNWFPQGTMNLQDTTTEPSKINSISNKLK